MDDRRFRDDFDHAGWATATEAASSPVQLSPGKVTLTSQLPRRSPSAGDVARSLVQLLARPDRSAGADEVQAHASAGVAGTGTTLPHLAAIQASFGHHDIGGIRAHVGGAAADAAGAIGARAYATGSDVAFAATPDVHTAAHEAAHVVQQRGGVQLAGGVGQAGDRHEQHADAVADAVVRGESAVGLLDQYGDSGGSTVVQRLTAEERAAAQGNIVDRVSMEQIAHRIAYLDGDLPVTDRPANRGSGEAPARRTSGERARSGEDEARAAAEHWTAPRAARVDELDGNALTELGFDCQNLRFFTGQAGLQFWLLPALPDHPVTPVIAFRGSDTPADWRDDFNVEGVGMGQFTMNQAVIQQALQQLSGGGRGVVATGHSLGGALAQIAACHYPDIIVSVVTFQSPGVSREIIDRVRALPDDERPTAEHFRVDGCIVDDAGEEFLDGEVTVFDNGPVQVDPYHAHTDFPLLSLAVSAGEREKWMRAPSPEAIDPALHEEEDSMFDGRMLGLTGVAEYWRRHPVAATLLVAPLLGPLVAPVAVAGAVGVDLALGWGGDLDDQEAYARIWPEVLRHAEAGDRTSAQLINDLIKDPCLAADIADQIVPMAHQLDEMFPEYGVMARVAAAGTAMGSAEEFVAAVRAELPISGRQEARVWAQYLLLTGPHAAPELRERPPIGPVFNPTPTLPADLDHGVRAIGEAASDVVDWLHGVVERGEREVERAIRSVPVPDLAPALRAVPEAARTLVNQYWPDNSGWMAHIAGEGTLSLEATDAAIPASLELGAEAACDVSIRRVGPAITIGFQATAAGSGELDVSLKAVDLGRGRKVEGALGVTVTIDLDRITWPPGALEALFNGDLRGALRQLMSAAMVIGRNTQLDVQLAAGREDFGVVGVGLHHIAEAAAQAGVRYGAQVSLATPTEAREGRVELRGEAGLFASFEVGVGGADAGELQVLNTSLPILAAALAAIGVEDLPELHGEAAASAAISMRITGIVPKLDAPGEVRWEVAIGGAAQLQGGLLGQEGELNGRGELVIPVAELAAFAAAIRNGQVSDLGDVAALLPFSEITTSLSAQVAFRDYIGLFPVLADLIPELEGDPDRVQLTIQADFHATRPQLEALQARTSGGASRAMGQLATGQVVPALRTLADLATEGVADVAGFLDRISFDAQVGRAGELDGHSPLAGIVTGVEGELSGHVSRTYHREWDAAALGIPNVQRWLRGLVVGDGATPEIAGDTGADVVAVGGNTNPSASDATSNEPDRAQSIGALGQNSLRSNRSRANRPTTPAVAKNRAWLGATLIPGKPGQFRGSFDESIVVNGTHWSWNGYPTGPITRHPANDFMKFSNAGDLSQLRPISRSAHDYVFTPGTTTDGGKAFGGLLKEWRAYVDSRVKAHLRMRQASEPDPAAVPPPAAQNVRDEQADLDDAQDCVVREYSDEFPGLGFSDLVLEGKGPMLEEGTDSRHWQAHHIHESSWGGPDEEPRNFQYLALDAEHQQLSKWWNRRRDEINKNLGIETRRKDLDPEAATDGADE